jgi:hypothetical protein
MAEAAVGLPKPKPPHRGAAAFLVADLRPLDESNRNLNWKLATGDCKLLVYEYFNFWDYQA